MLTFKPKRRQGDGKGDAESNRTASRHEDEGLVRQEMLETSNINYILSRFGAMPQQAIPRYGEIDYTVDLQQATAALEDAHDAYQRIPDELREKYPNVSTMLNGLATGEFGKDYEAVVKTRRETEYQNTREKQRKERREEARADAIDRATRMARLDDLQEGDEGRSRPSPKVDT